MTHILTHLKKIDMTVYDLINSDAFKKADDNVTIWSWDRLNGYYQFNSYYAHIGRFVRLTRAKERSMTKRSFLEHIDEYLSLSLEINVWKRLMFTYVTDGCSVALEDRGIVIRRDESLDMEQAEKNFFKVNKITKEMMKIPEGFNDGEYA